MLDSKNKWIWINSILAIASLLIGFFAIGVANAYAETVFGETNAYGFVTLGEQANVEGNVGFYGYKDLTFTPFFTNTGADINRIEIPKPKIGLATSSVLCSNISLVSYNTGTTYFFSLSESDDGTICYADTLILENGESLNGIAVLNFSSSAFPAASTYSFSFSTYDAIIQNISDEIILENSILTYQLCRDTCDDIFPDPNEPQLINFSRNYNTRFTDVDYSLSSTTLEIDVDFFVDLTEINSSTPERNPTDIQVRWSLYPTTDIDSQSFTLNPLTQGSNSLSVQATDIVDGKYDIIINFANLGSILGFNDTPFKETNIQFTFEVSGGVIIATSTTEFYTGQDIENPENIVCSLSSIDGCLTKAVMFLIIPGEWGLSALDTVYAEMSTRFPFAYLTDFKDSITEIYTNPTTQTLGITIPFATYGNITLISGEMVSDFPLSSPIRILLGALLWVMLAVQMWRRTQRIFNPSAI